MFQDLLLMPLGYWFSQRFTLLRSMLRLNLACKQKELISNKDFHIVRAINIIFVNKNYLVNLISNPIMKKKIEKVIKKPYEFISEERILVS